MTTAKSADVSRELARPNDIERRNSEVTVHATSHNTSFSRDLIASSGSGVSFALGLGFLLLAWLVTPMFIIGGLACFATSAAGARSLNHWHAKRRTADFKKAVEEWADNQANTIEYRKEKSYYHSSHQRTQTSERLQDETMSSLDSKTRRAIQRGKPVVISVPNHKVPQVFEETSEYVEYCAEKEEAQWRHHGFGVARAERQARLYKLERTVEKNRKKWEAEQALYQRKGHAQLVFNGAHWESHMWTDISPAGEWLDAIEHAIDL